jgi:triacylglycerol lipase
MNLVLATLAGLTAAFVALAALNRLAPASAMRWALGLERWRAGLQLRSIVVDGQRVPYLEGGQGEPLLLLHGFAADKDNFVLVARHLGPHFRLIIPDLAGFGEAGRDPAARYRMSDQADRMWRLMDALGIARVHLGGSSMGGFIAGQMAGSRAERVASLWLINAAGTTAAHASALLLRYQDTGDVPLLVRRVEDYPALLAVSAYRRPYLPWCVNHELALRAVADVELHSQIMREMAFESPALEVTFARISPPTLITWGQEDAILAPAGAAAQQALCSHAQLLRLPGIGHLPMIEDPPLAAAGYLAFRQRLAA